MTIDMNAIRERQARELQEYRSNTFAEMQKILDNAARAQRDLTTDEARRYDELDKHLDHLNEQAKEDENAKYRDNRFLPGGDTTPDNDNARWIDPRTQQEVRVLGMDENLADYQPEARDFSARDTGMFLRGVLTGNWEGARTELRDMSGLTDAAGGHMVPEPLGARVIDLARNQTRLFQAGAMTVPMSSATLKLARITDDPAPAWRGETDAVSEDDVTLDAVTLQAESLAVIVKVSRELLDDAPNAGDVIAQSLAGAMAVELDRVGLYGSGSSNEPEGLINMSGLDTQSMGTDGDDLTDFDPIVDSIQAIWGNNHEPNAYILAPRTAADLQKLKDTTNQPLRAPEAVSNLRRLVTNQVPTTRTQGSSDDASDILVGNYRRYMVGMRQQLRIQPLSERYASELSVGFLCYMRAATAVEDLGAFSAVVGVRST